MTVAPVVTREELFLRASPVASRVAAYVTAAAMGAPILYHVARGSSAYLGLFEDDFFYYAVVADKLVTHGLLTFDGVTLTNGFHPLWFLVLLATRVMCGGLGPAFFAVLALLLIASMVATYELSRRFASALGVSPGLAPVLAVAPCIAANKLVATGMEVAIAMPLFLWLLTEVARGTELTPRRAAKLGLLASLAILARLDIAIGVAMLVAAWLLFARPPIAKAVRALAAFCTGGVAVAVYALANRVFFGAWLPLSAMAKQIQTRPGFNVGFVRTALLSSVYGPLACVLLVASLAALAALVFGRGPHAGGRPRPAALVAGGVALLFPLVFYVINALKSDWVFFAWYGYALAPAMIAAPALLCAWAAPFARGVWGKRAVLVAATLLVALVPVRGVRYFLMYGPRWSIADNTLTAMAFDLRDRLAGRDGVFAMGAIAGTTAFVLDKPIVQLEGLVADRAMIEHLRAQDRLQDVLAAYHVDYLIVSVSKPVVEKNGACYTVDHPDPEWAGERSSRIRGTICAEPIARFSTPRSPLASGRFDALDTYVFDVRR